MSGKIGLPESVSMAIGGMVGGGIFAVLGVVAKAASYSSWIAFTLAGIIAMCAGYSFIRLNEITDGRHSPITFIQTFTGSKKLGGMAGWTFIFGYVGTMAMYAFAFGGYFEELIGVHTFHGMALRPVISLSVIVLFVGLNILGAHASGRTEDFLVGAKILILLIFGFGGLYYGLRNGMLHSGLSTLSVGPLIAAAISFVAFEGWELLMFDQDSIKNPKETIKKAIFASIAVATFIYVIVAIVTTNLVSSSVIAEHAETALAVAARPFLGQLGFILIAVAAIFSTGSAINATLFSSARLSRKMVSKNLLPSKLRGDGDEPVKALLVLGALTGGLTVLGSLNAITSFASLAFITIFGGISILAFRERDNTVNAVVPAVGALGSAATVVALLWHLWSTEFHVFISVIGLALGVTTVEIFYFEREEIEEVEEEVEEEIEEVEEEIEEDLEE
ncbi:MAG: APC family permease [Candidatus Nanohaloarchaea archaeon]